MSYYFSGQNEEDKRIWKAIVDFDFQRYGVPSGGTDSELKEKLFESIFKVIGTCGQCVAFNQTKCYCNTLKTVTDKDDRCSDFEKLLDTSTESPFEVMAEPFQHLRSKTTEESAE